jgi:hypothetical protein
MTVRKGGDGRASCSLKAHGALARCLGGLGVRFVIFPGFWLDFGLFGPFAGLFGPVWAFGVSIAQLSRDNP